MLTGIDTYLVAWVTSPEERLEPAVITPEGEVLTLGSEPFPAKLLNDRDFISRILSRFALDLRSHVLSRSGLHSSVGALEGELLCETVDEDGEVEHWEILGFGIEYRSLFLKAYQSLKRENKKRLKVVSDERK